MVDMPQKAQTPPGGPGKKNQPEKNLAMEQERLRRLLERIIILFAILAALFLLLVAAVISMSGLP